MKKVISNRVNMIRTTVNYCNLNTAATSGIPAFAGKLTEIENKLTLIDSLNGIATGTSKGVTVDTKLVRLAMSNIALKVGNAVSAYAASVNNTLLLKVTYTLPQLDKMKKEDVDDVCQVIHDEANSNIASAGAFGYDATDVTDLDTAIAVYRIASQNPRQAIISKTQAINSITAMTKDIVSNLLKKQLDKMVNTLKQTQPTFVEGYFLSREIIDLAGPGEGNVTLSGILTDAETGDPIADAVFVVGPYTFTTAADGSFSKKLQIDTPTTYNVTITADDYETVNTTYQFTPGVDINQDLQMNPLVLAAGSISGVARDAGTLMGLGGATIGLVNGNTVINLTADANGNFSGIGMPVGMYTATASAPGYIGQSVSVIINANSNTVQDFNLVVVP